MSALFIILVSLTMTLFSEKILISNRCIRGLMSNLFKKSWTVSNLEGKPSLVPLRVLWVRKLSKPVYWWLTLNIFFIPTSKAVGHGLPNSLESLHLQLWDDLTWQKMKIIIFFLKFFNIFFWKNEFFFGKNEIFFN